MSYPTIFKSLSYVLFVPTSLLMLGLSPAFAACLIAPGVGNDSFTCSSGTSPGFSDLSGSNSLISPANGTGVVTGSVFFGVGNDRVLMNSGTIDGDLEQGEGRDSLVINGGVISGVVRQGGGTDDFVMTSGSIGSLFQGDALDTFLMTGGTIVSAYEDGDYAKMTGGTIGRVNMKLDNNTFDMSGGEIFGNLVTGFGTDTIIVSGGKIGGNISVSGGDDSITVSGGEIAGQILASFGNDRLMWDGGGLIRSEILMGAGEDSAVLRNLTEATLSITPLIDGGPGNDPLTFDHTSSAGANRYTNWETVNLSNGSHFDLAGNFVLGDSASGTGVFNIDDSSVLAAGQGVVTPFTAGQPVILNNAGVIDMTTPNTRTNDTLTVQGNYFGNSGQLFLQSVLGDDSSPSDKLVVNNGTLSGNTLIAVSNLGGAGGLTRQNGIQLVQAQRSAVSENGAFALKGPVSAGAFDYRLFKGGVTAGTENSWYLRSAVVAPAVTAIPNPDPSLPPLLVPVVATPIAALAPAGSAALQNLPVAVPGAEPIPLYRPEVPTWSVLPPAAAMLTMSALGTFHDRQGDQRLLKENGAFSAGWGRVYGKSIGQTWAGTVTPRIDGSLSGFQVGNDLYSSQTAGGLNQRTGFFVGHTRLQGDVDGFNEGFQGRRAGKIELEGDSFGLYWTLTDPVGWYVDTVVMGTRLDGDSRSERGLKLDNRGHALTLSAEAGYPVDVGGDWVVEPQVQIIHQKISLDSQDDGISRVSFDSDGAWTGRLGARLKGRYEVSGKPLEPYVRANVWHTVSGSDTVTFDNVDQIKTEQKASSADVGVGVILSLDSAVSVYASADYSSNIDSNQLRGLGANIGVRVSW